MSTNLTLLQRNELFQAIYAFLHVEGFVKTAEQFRNEEPSLAQIDASLGKARVLVSKWTAVSGLLKKNVELQKRLTRAEDEIARGATGRNSSERTDPDWLPDSGENKHELTGHAASVNAVAFHPVYSVLCTAGDDFKLKIWDWETGHFERTLTGHRERVTDVEYNSKGNLLVSASNDTTARVWNVNEHYKNVATLEGHDHSVSTARFMPDDEHVITASRDGKVRLWQVSSKQCTKVMDPGLGWIRSAVPSSDGRSIALAASGDGIHSAAVLETGSWLVKCIMRGHEKAVEYAMFVPPEAVPAVRELVGQKNTSIASGTTSRLYITTVSRDNQMKLWDARSGECLHTFTGHDNWITALVFHPSGKHVITTSYDKTFRIWDLKTGRCLRDVPAHSNVVTSLAWGRQATGYQDDVKEAGEVARVVNVLATSSTDNTVRIWMP